MVIAIVKVTHHAVDVVVKAQCLMPLIVFDCKGIPATRRERIETAVESEGRHVKEQYEGWIAVDPFVVE